MLVNCAAYQDGRKLADIGVAEISDYLARPGCLVWVALKDPSNDELAQMQEEFSLHELAVEDARHGHQRPKVEEYGSSLFVVLHLLEEIEGDLHLGEVNYVLSVRTNSSEGFAEVRRRCEREPELLRNGSGFVLYALMDAVVDRYFPVLDAIESELEAVEEQIFEKAAAQSNIERLYGLKRKATQLRHAVAPLLEAVGKLHGGRVPPMCAGSQDYFRDVYDHLARINTALDSVRETIGTAIQVSLSAVAIDQNDVNKRLAAWAGIFAVVTAFAGIWGMNFKAMPELAWDYGYPVALLLIAATSGVLYWRFRKAGWL